MQPALFVLLCFLLGDVATAQTQSPKVNADTTPAGSDVPIADDAGSGEASGLEDGFDFTTRCDDADAVAGEGCDGRIGSSIADFAKDKLNLDIDSLTEGVPRWMVLLWSVTAGVFLLGLLTCLAARLICGKRDRSDTYNAHMQDQNRRQSTDGYQLQQSRINAATAANPQFAMGTLNLKGGGKSGGLGKELDAAEGKGGELPFVITASIREVFERKTVPRSAIEMSSKVLMTDGETATEVVKCKLKVDDRGKPIAAGYQGDSTKRVAASKRLTPGAYSRTQRSDFHREAFLRAGLSSHAQVVNCLGVQMDMEPEYIFIDFAAKGNLRSILRNTKASKNITGHEMVTYAVQLAEGMKFLSDNNIVHRNFSLLSTAVEDNGMVKVGNFACARDLPPLGKYRKKDGADLILFKWAAPEVLRGTAFSTASDVWSFGIAMFEIFTMGASPYPNMSPEEILESILSGDTMPKGLLEHVSNDLWMVVKRCWTMGALDRPTFTMIVGWLELLVGAAAAHARQPPKGFLWRQGTESDNNRLSDVFELQVLQQIVQAKSTGKSGGAGSGGGVVRDRSKSMMRVREVQQGMLVEDDGEGEVYSQLDEVDESTYSAPDESTYSVPGGDDDEHIGETRFGHAPRPTPAGPVAEGPVVPERPSLQAKARFDPKPAPFEPKSYENTVISGKPAAASSTRDEKAQAQLANLRAKKAQGPSMAAEAPKPGMGSSGDGDVYGNSVFNVAT